MTRTTKKKPHFVVQPRKISEIDGSEPSIYDSGCPNCIAPAYSGPCTAQACSPSISYDGTLPGFIDPKKAPQKEEEEKPTEKK
jgi:hypothetical protein